MAVRTTAHTAAHNEGGFLSYLLRHGASGAPPAVPTSALCLTSPMRAPQRSTHGSYRHTAAPDHRVRTGSCRVRPQQSAPWRTAARDYRVTCYSGTYDSIGPTCRCTSHSFNQGAVPRPYCSADSASSTGAELPSRLPTPTAQRTLRPQLAARAVFLRTLRRSFCQAVFLLIAKQVSATISRQFCAPAARFSCRHHTSFPSPHVGGEGGCWSLCAATCTLDTCPPPGPSAL